MQQRTRPTKTQEVTAMNAVSLIVTELNAAGQTMRDCAASVPCNLAADLRRHEAEEARREAEVAAIDERVFSLLETDCNPLAAENLAEALSEMFARPEGEALAAKIAELMTNDRSSVSVMLGAISRQYWTGEALAKAERAHEGAMSPCHFAGVRSFLDLM
jgi:hypothetical protein